MKKIFSIVTLLSLFVIPVFVFADAPTIPTQCMMKSDVTGLVPGCPSSGAPSVFDNKYGSGNAEVTGAMCCLMNTISVVTNWIFLILTSVAVIMVILGGFKMVTSQGNPEQFTAGRTLVLYALIGIAVALLAKFVPGIAKFIVGV